MSAKAKRKKPALSREQTVAIFCVKNGHSKLRDFFFGYHYCVRCGDQLGDSLGSIYGGEPGTVYVHHMHVFTKDGTRYAGCECPENAKKLTKRDYAHVAQWNSWGFEQRPPWREKESK